MYSPRIVIVGAGFGGISAAVELRRHGFEDITILERAPDLGGTWFYNSYPGAACDVPSHLYSFSYEQRSDWSRLCSPQQEILHYLRSVADSRGVSDAIRFSQPVSECTFDPCGRRWTVETESGSSYDADMLIVATGQLSRPWIPSLPGLERYAGHSFHSARWDHGYDLAGRRVAVVGTGASAVQFVPEIARRVAHLTVFQRTGNWFLPRHNRVYSPLVRAAIRRIPGLQQLRRAVLFQYCESLTLAIRHPRTVGRLVGWRSAGFMRRQVPDRALRRRAWPDYAFGCKRILFSSHYLPTLSRPHVTLVTEPIQEVSATGLRTADGRLHELDCIIWATGFKATEFVAPMRVHGAGGQALEDVWSDGAHAHLGMCVPGFPSMFLMYGPNTNTSGGSIIFYLEAQASYIRQALEHVRAGGHRTVEVRPEWRRPPTTNCRRGLPEPRGPAVTRGTATGAAGSWPTGRGTCAST
ncbi:MAG: flavin-containing monooxygenase [Solirubrobacteraceae bacterium]